MASTSHDVLTLTVLKIRIVVPQGKCKLMTHPALVGECIVGMASTSHDVLTHCTQDPHRSASRIASYLL